MKNELTFSLINGANMYSAVMLAKEIFPTEFDNTNVFQPTYSYKYAFDEGNKTCWYYLVKQGDQTIGTIGYYFSRSHPKETELWIGYLGIKPYFRKQGLGAQMLRKMIDHICSTHPKVETIKLFTSNTDGNKDGHHLYPKLGFALYRTVQTKPYETCYFKKSLKIPD